METIADILGGIGFLMVVVCHIIVIVKMFQNGKTGLGILALVLTCCCGVGGLFTFIYGWVKSAEWNLKNVMLAYSVGIVLNFASGLVTPADVRAARQKQIEDLFNKQ